MGGGGTTVTPCRDEREGQHRDGPSMEGWDGVGGAHGGEGAPLWRRRRENASNIHFSVVMYE